MFLLLTGDVWFRFRATCRGEAQLPAVCSLTSEMVLLSAEPQFLQQQRLMEGCDFPAAIPP